MFKFNPFTQHFDISADAIWGNIVGTLSDQTDLQNALDNKSDIGHQHVAADISDFDLEVSNNIDVAANTAARHDQNTDTYLDLGGANEITVAELRTHVDSTSNPHNVLATQITDFDTEVENNTEVAANTAARHTQNTDTYLDLGGANEVTAAELRSHLDNPNAHDASEIDTDTTNFDGALTSADDTVQKALDTLDDVVGGMRVRQWNYPAPDTNASYGDYRVLALGNNSSATMSFSIPDDFVSLISLEVVFIPSGPVSGSIDLQSDYGAIGELSTTHSESALAVPITATTGIITAFNVAQIFTNLSAGDFCGLYWKNNAVGNTTNVVFIRIKYNGF